MKPHLTHLPSNKLNRVLLGISRLYFPVFSLKKGANALTIRLVELEEDIEERAPETLTSAVLASFSWWTLDAQRKSCGHRGYEARRCSQ